MSRETPEEKVVDSQLREFEEIHGYPWPNCAIADCQYKACVPSEFCWPHTDEATRREIRPHFFKDAAAKARKSG